MTNYQTSRYVELSFCVAMQYPATSGKDTQAEGPTTFAA